MVKTRNAVTVALIAATGWWSLLSAGAQDASPPAKPQPVTLGGTVESGPVLFLDGTKAAGLDKWRHRSGDDEKRYILETAGSGVAILDFDNDGWPDIYLVNGSTLAAEQGKEAAARAALFRNNHDGTFTDVAARAGVTNDRWGMGAAVGDFDNDGWPDLYVTNFGRNRLYHNNGDGTFTDVAEQAGVTVGGWSTGATWGDYDGDGLLDLFVPGYVKFDVNDPPAPGSKSLGSSFCQYRGANVMCGPRGLKGERDHLFRNNGNGTFTDMSEAAGVADAGGYYGWASAFVDVNDDGRLDLLVVNDSTPRYLYLNRGDGTFEDASYPSGFAVNANGREQAGMGLALGDSRNAGRLDLYVTNFSDDYNTLYQDEGEGSFTDVSFEAGVGETTIPFLGWGTAFLDLDNDGRVDLLVADGHVYRQIDHLDWGTTWAQRPLLFQNQGEGRFRVAPATVGTALAMALTGRGLAVADLFNEGRMDAVINNIDGPPTLLRNAVKNGHHWVGLRLVGSGKSPRDAIGARVTLTAGGRMQRADVVSGGSFMSNNDLRLHFGLGDVAAVDSLQIRWPSGRVESVTLNGVDRIFTLEEGKGVVERATPAARPARPPASTPRRPATKKR
jgi:hypothetical protein